MKNKIKIGLLTALVVMLFVPAVVSAQGGYRWTSQDPLLNPTPTTATGPLKHKIPYHLQAYSTRSNYWTDIKWYTVNTTLDGYMSSRANAWNLMPFFPDWFKIDPVMSTVNNYHVLGMTGTCPNNRAGCVGVVTWKYRYGANVYMVKNYNLIVDPNFSQWGNSFRNKVVAHEWGHVLGLGHPWTGSNCAGFQTIMDNEGCSTSLEGPSLHDAEDVGDLYEACSDTNGSCSGATFMSGGWNGNVFETNWRHESWFTYSVRAEYYRSNSSSGPWTKFYTAYHNFDIGFWEGAVPSTNGKYIMHINRDIAGDVSIGQYTKVCVRPLATLSHTGRRTCSNPLQRFP